jgi:hypothetical protein
MPNPAPPYFLILDTNIWVAERLLHSSLGSAVLHALAVDGATVRCCISECRDCWRHSALPAVTDAVPAC